MNFSHFCHCGNEEYNQLKNSVDACACQGYSYEFAACRMPCGCYPETVQIGFWKDRGVYLLYFRPTVSYQGAEAILQDFFAQGDIQRYPSFAALTEALQRLRACTN